MFLYGREIRALFPAKRRAYPDYDVGSFPFFSVFNHNYFVLAAVPFEVLAFQATFAFFTLYVFPFYVFITPRAELGYNILTHDISFHKPFFKSAYKKAEKHIHVGATYISLKSLEIERFESP